MKPLIEFEVLVLAWEPECWACWRRSSLRCVELSPPSIRLQRMMSSLLPTTASWPWENSQSTLTASCQWKTRFVHLYVFLPFSVEASVLYVHILTIRLFVLPHCSSSSRWSTLWTKSNTCHTIGNRGPWSRETAPLSLDRVGWVGQRSPLMPWITLLLICCSILPGIVLLCVCVKSQH